MKTPSSHTALCFLIGFTSISQALTIDNYSDETNLRFANDPSFIGDDFDLSGVGRSNGTWGTAIGDHYFLSANHFHPNPSSIITFTTNSALSQTSYSYTVGGGFRLGTTDLWLGYTTEIFAPEITRYAVTTQDADSLSDLGLGSSTLYMNGDQVAGSPGNVTDQVLGTNQAESFYEEGSGILNVPQAQLNFSAPSGFENDMIVLFDNLTGDDNPALFHESLLQGGDSGSPLFSASGNQLTVLGTASLLLNGVSGNFINTFGRDDFETRDASAYSYVGSYQSELEAAIANVPAIAVPEPSSVTLLLIVAGFGIPRRRRS